MKQEIYKGDRETYVTKIYDGHFGGHNVGNHQIITRLTVNNKEQRLREFSIAETYEKSKDYERLSFKVDNSPCWLSVNVVKYKNNRNTQIFMSLDKNQILDLIDELSKMVSYLNERT